jgi:hypothetical protein
MNIELMSGNITFVSEDVAELLGNPNCNPAQLEACLSPVKDGFLLLGGTDSLRACGLEKEADSIDATMRRLCGVDLFEMEWPEDEDEFEAFMIRYFGEEEEETEEEKEQRRLLEEYEEQFWRALNNGETPPPPPPALMRGTQSHDGVS